MFKKTTAVILTVLMILLYPCQLDASAADTPVQGSGNQVSAAVVDFSTGLGFCLAVRSDGTLWAWGANHKGQLGDGTKAVRTTPVQIGKDTDWIKVAAGNTHSLALKKDGSLWAWGDNTCGQLGDGTITDRLSPVKISSDCFTNIAAGTTYSLAIRKDGTLWESGDMKRSRLDKTSMGKAKLRQVGKGNWKSVSIGNIHALAIDANGSLWAWGLGGNGEFGNGNAKGNYDFPVQIDKSTDWVQVSAGWADSMALKKDGTLWRWGFDPSNNNILKPTMVGKDTDWVSFTTRGFVCAIKSDGSLWTWGTYSGASGVTEPNNIPQAAPQRIGSDKGWKKVDSDFSAGVALKEDGTLWSWGLNDNGEFGNGQMINNLNPVRIGGDADWKQVSAGDSHTLAVRNDGSLWSWGSNVSGELGIGNRSFASTAPMRVGTGNNWAKAVSVWDTSLALTSDGTLWGWGSNNEGLLCNSGSYATAPVKIGEDSVWTDFCATSCMVLGLKKDGTIWIWGIDPNGSLYGSKRIITTPVKVGVDSDWSKISAGGASCGYVMALKKDGSLWGWGFETYGRIGNFYKDGHNFLRIGKSNDWKELATGSDYAYALKKDGTAWYWKLSLRTNADKVVSDPVQLGIGKYWVKASGYTRHFILLKNDGTLWGKGANESGQLGDGTKMESKDFIAVASGSAWSSISTGDTYSMAIRKDGTLWGWGSNDYNQLGFEKPSYATIPVKIAFSKEPSLYYSGNAIAYGNGIYVYTAGGNIWFSTDAVVWEKTVLKQPVKLNDIVFNGKTFVAVGEWGAILTSIDGKTWTTCYSGTVENLGSIAWGNNLFVTVGERGTILVSGDGARWASVGLKNNFLFRKVVFAGNKFVASGDTLTENPGFMMESTDGMKWILTEPPTPNCPLTDIAWDGQSMTAIGSDGLIWKTVSFGWVIVSKPSTAPTSIVWDNYELITTGDQTLSSSSDGRYWTDHKSDTYGLVQCACVGSKFVAVNSKGFVLTSTDGITWTVSEKPLPGFAQQ